MKLILHIGTEKTGSSSIQLTLANQRELLAERGLWYPASLGPDAHRKMSLYGRDYQNAVKDDRLLRYGGTSPEDFAALEATIEGELEKEVALARLRNCSHFMMSCEYFSSLYANERETTKLAQLCRRFFDDIAVLCFIRPQVDVLISRLSTLACDGIVITESTITDLAREKQYFDFDAMLERWAAAFGRESIVPVSYKRQKDVLAYLRQETGIDIPAVGLERVNQSIDVEAIGVLNAARVDGPTLVSVGRYLKDFGARSKLTLSPEHHASVQSIFDASNDALLRKWPSLTADDLAVSSPQTGGSNSHLLESAAPFAEQLKYVFQRFQTDTGGTQTSYRYIRSKDVTLAVPTEHFAERYLQGGGLFRPLVVPFFEDLVKEGQTVIDVGANVGFFSLVAAQRVGSTGKVVSIDPSARAIAGLLRATQVNGVRNVTTVIAAAYDTCCTLMIAHNQASTNCVVRRLPEGGFDTIAPERLVSAITIDQTVHDLKRCDVIRIAVGGNELPALRGATNVLKQFRPTVISEYSPDYQSDVHGNSALEFWELFADLGYRCSVIVADGKVDAIPNINSLLERYARARQACEGATHLDLCFEHPKP
ncbi:FkbM family methyltransferase [Paraburkholderia sp. RCC_158]|uniref:FkbM family methyltransferase n=1 Tax=Paraburkholderia sp. RCC_158 TaxID=3239220 RepID=UPI0035244F44